MEECYYKKNQVPAFGSWDWNDNLPFTQCFETARQAGLLRCSYSESEERDLYVTGDLYENNVVTPAMIVVPRRRTRMLDQHEKETKLKNWMSDVDSEPPSPTPLPRPTSKPVDEDLYKISPGLLYAKAKKHFLTLFLSHFIGCRREGCVSFLVACCHLALLETQGRVDANVHICEIEE
ncbi:unnamed protein product [Sphenostylis stenocarpa]|uniref:Uncharacterized protein n=1 Tax=Sphenostylis stenocarpa TaxID=92480 RepID=A0AA86V0Q5_9FABA|nr:unnamed protein product [Sphenostylis stenocarpa]